MTDDELRIYKEFISDGDPFAGSLTNLNTYTSTSASTSGDISIDDLMKLKDILPPSPDLLIVHQSGRPQLNSLPSISPPYHFGLPVWFWSDFDELDESIDAAKASGFKRWLVFDSMGAVLANRSAFRGEIRKQKGTP